MAPPGLFFRSLVGDALAAACRDKNHRKGFFLGGQVGHEHAGWVGGWVGVGVGRSEIP